MRPRSFVLNVSPWLTPGISVPSCRKLRPFSGSSRTISPVTTPETSPPMVFTGREEASTVMTSLSCPVPSSKSIPRSSAALSTTPVRDPPLKPCNSAVTLYSPTGSTGTEYTPAAFVTTVRDRPVSSFKTVTVAPGRTDCVASLTVPRMLPVDRWANVGVATKSDETTRTRTGFRMRGRLPELPKTT